MKSSTVLGLLCGVLLTIAGGIYLTDLQNSQSSQTSQNATLPINTFAIEPADLPLVQVFDSFQSTFPGSDDLLAYRAKLSPRMDLTIWDRTFKDLGLTVSMQVGSDCRNADINEAIYIPPIHADAVASGKINMLFLDRPPIRCYANNSKVAVLIDDLAGGKTYYQFAGEATIQRIKEIQLTRLPDTFFKEAGITRSDVWFLANPGALPIRSTDTYTTILLFTMTGQRPLLDLKTIPSFVPGAEVIKADSVGRYFKGLKLPVKPVFVDARDRKNISSGATYPGAIQVPFISSNPIQFKFQLEFPLSALAGAKFDLRLLPKDRQTPLIIFGNDANDPTPLWMIRNLRQQGYRTLYFVSGGLKALQEAKTTIEF